MSEVDHNGYTEVGLLLTRLERAHDIAVGRETMPQQPDPKAWNNFVMNSDPSALPADSNKRAAAIAYLFMGAANNGGINSFLTACPEIGSQELLNALRDVGAVEAVKQLKVMLAGLGESLPPSSQEARWNLLDRLWTDDLDDQDTLSTEADSELMRVLEKHVSENEPYYFALGNGRP